MVELQPARPLMGGLDGVLKDGVLRIFFFRHGESVVNLRNKEIIGGRMSASPLTAKGRTQAKSLGKWLKNEGIRFDNVYSSTAVRAIQTAEIACSEIGFDTAKIIRSDSLLEIDQGEWSGKSRPGCMTAEVVKRIQHNPIDFHAPGGESQRDVERRMTKFITEAIIDEHKRGSKPIKTATIGIFSHGMAIRCFIHGILQSDPAMTWKIHMENCNVSELWFDSVLGWRLMRMNQTVPHSLLELPTPKL